MKVFPEASPTPRWKAMCAACRSIGSGLSIRERYSCKTSSSCAMRSPDSSPKMPSMTTMSLATRTLASSRNSSPGIDITDVASVKEFFNQAGSFYAIVAALGSAPFVYLKDADTEYFQAGFNNKLHGQINLVMHGLDHLADGGSFTLITGILPQ